MTVYLRIDLTRHGYYIRNHEHNALANAKCLGGRGYYFKQQGHGFENVEGKKKPLHVVQCSRHWPTLGPGMERFVHIPR
jgi:hypothetical protein